MYLIETKVEEQAITNYYGKNGVAHCFIVFDIFAMKPIDWNYSKSKVLDSKEINEVVAFVDKFEFLSVEENNAFIDVLFAK